MPRILVIADDLTGAAEIGGLAHGMGLQTGIFTSYARVDQSVDAVIIDTHTRNKDATDVPEIIRTKLKGLEPKKYDLIYKKTDSVLRGPVYTELREVMSLCGKTKTLLVPANPSKNRLIIDGRYFIDGRPIDETGFNDDPDYPRTSSCVEEMIVDNSGVVSFVHDFDPALDGAVLIPPVRSGSDLTEHVNRMTSEWLPAGGADFFKEILMQKFGLKEQEIFNHGSSDTLQQEKNFYMIGSCTKESKAMIRYLREKNYTEVSLTREMIENESLWINMIRGFNSDDLNKIIMTAPTGKIHEERLRKRITAVLAAGFAKLWKGLQPGFHLYIEGGETASEIVALMKWDQLRIIGQHKRGTVTMDCGKGKPVLTVKPGSYRWPEEYFI